MKHRDKKILKAAAIPAGAITVITLASANVLAAEQDPVAAPDALAPAAVVETTDVADEIVSTEITLDEAPAVDEAVDEEVADEEETTDDNDNTAGDQVDVALPEEGTDADPVVPGEIEDADAEETPSEEADGEDTAEEPGENEEDSEDTDAADEEEKDIEDAADETEDTEEASNQLTGDREAAIHNVYIPKTDEDGETHKEPISQWVIDRLDAPITGTITEEDGKKVLTVDFQIQDVFLDDQAKNGLGGEESTTGQSYVNVTNYYVKVLQAKAMLDENPDATLVDSEGNVVDAETLDSLIELLEQISMFDPTTDLKYIWPEEGLSDGSNPADTCNVLATSKDGNASFKFHIDSHGWWGYELAGDTLMSQLMSNTDTDGNVLVDADGNELSGRALNNYLATKYGNFFVIEMGSDDNGTWYMLKDTDLEAPYLFISKDGKKAALIDCDFYGENVLNNILKTLLGNDCEEFKILITHMHGDHTNNLGVIVKDPYLKSITTVYYPEGEDHAMVNGVDVVAPFNIHYIKDMEIFEAGGNTFQFLQIPDEHTPMGGAFANLTRNLFFSGDTLGAQIHLGGTNVNVAQLDSWIDGVQRIVDYIDEHEIKFNFGGHTNYACSSEFARWMLTALKEAKAQLEANPEWASKGQLVIVENGQIITPERRAEMMQNGLSDKDELNVLSVNFRGTVHPDEKPDEKPEEKPDEKPSDENKDDQKAEDKKDDDKKEDETKTPSGNNTTTGKIDSLKTDKVTSPKTAAASNGLFYMMSSLSAGIGAIFFGKRKSKK